MPRTTADTFQALALVSSVLLRLTAESGLLRKLYDDGLGQSFRGKTFSRRFCLHRVCLQSMCPSVLRLQKTLQVAAATSSQLLPVARTSQVVSGSCWPSLYSYRSQHKQEIKSQETAAKKAHAHPLRKWGAEPCKAMTPAGPGLSGDEFSDHQARILG